MLRLPNTALAFLLLIVSACTQAPVEDASATNETVTELSSSDSTPVASVTASTLPTIAFVATSLPADELPTAIPVEYPTITPSSTLTSTPTAVVLPSDFSPVLLGRKYDADTFFTVLGGVQGGSWLSVDQAVANIPGAVAYDVYGSAGGPYPVYGYAPEKSMPYNEYFVSTDMTLNDVGMVAVARGWRVVHRTAEELSPDNDLYRQVVKDWLSKAGVADPQTGTMHIYRIDLEGDGTDEIFISDTRVESQHGVVAGDHSIVLMRKVSGNGVVTIPVLVDLYASIGYGNPFPCSYSVANFLDLNQDGVLEVLVTYDRWEAFGASVHQLRGETMDQVLGKTCINP